jgi:ubiquinone/menaquinone biosynthesis C-methylase UbiE
MDNVGKNGRIKRDMFSGVKGKVLEVGIGTGHNVRYYPSEGDFSGIDISEKMLKRARKKAGKHAKSIRLEVMDVQDLKFPDETFDTVVTTCVFCSVRDPLKGLAEIRRVMKPGGRLLMYEHVLSKNRLLAFFMTAINPFVSWLFGPNINRDTTGNIKKAGLNVVKEENIQYDIFKRIDAVKV